MIKKILLLSALSLIPLSSNADTLKNLVKKTEKCSRDNCPYSYEFLNQPKVQKAVTKAFNRSNIKLPYWIFDDPTSLPVTL